MGTNLQLNFLSFRCHENKKLLKWVDNKHSINTLLLFVVKWYFLALFQPYLGVKFLLELSNDIYGLRHYITLISHYNYKYISTN